MYNLGSKPIADNRFSVRCEHTFRMELYAPDVVATMSKRHDLAVLVDGGDLEIVWKTIGRHHPRVVPPYLDVRRQVAKKTIVGHDDIHIGRYAVVDRFEVGELGAEDFADRL